MSEVGIFDRLLEVAEQEYFAEAGDVSDELVVERAMRALGAPSVRHLQMLAQTIATSVPSELIRDLEIQDLLAVMWTLGAVAGVRAASNPGAQGS